jgi:putative transposase
MPNSKLLDSEECGVHRLDDARYRKRILMDIFKEYRHYPPHLFCPNAIYVITGSIMKKRHLMDSNEKKRFFCETLFKRVLQHNWQLEAWACLSNHYHFVARAPENASTMTTLIREVHSLSARYINAIDNETGRRIWWNYWDTCIRDERSYLSILRYVHENPVKHCVVEKAEDYPFCSYRWFIDVTNHEIQRKVLAQPIAYVQIYDEF